MLEYALQQYHERVSGPYRTILVHRHWRTYWTVCRAWMEAHWAVRVYDVGAVAPLVNNVAAQPRPSQQAVDRWGDDPAPHWEFRLVPVGGPIDRILVPPVNFSGLVGWVDPPFTREDSGDAPETYPWTEEPVGAWIRYSFDVPEGDLPDYVDEDELEEERLRQEQQSQQQQPPPQSPQQQEQQPPTPDTRTPRPETVPDVPRNPSPRPSPQQQTEQHVRETPSTVREESPEIVEIDPPVREPSPVRGPPPEVIVIDSDEEDPPLPSQQQPPQQQQQQQRQPSPPWLHESPEPPLWDAPPPTPPGQQSRPASPYHPAADEAPPPYEESEVVREERLYDAQLELDRQRSLQELDDLLVQQAEWQRTARLLRERRQRRERFNRAAEVAEETRDAADGDWRETLSPEHNEAREAPRPPSVPRTAPTPAEPAPADPGSDRPEPDLLRARTGPTSYFGVELTNAETGRSRYPGAEPVANPVPCDRCRDRRIECVGHPHRACVYCVVKARTKCSLATEGRAKKQAQGQKRANPESAETEGASKPAPKKKRRTNGSQARKQDRPAAQQQQQQQSAASGSRQRTREPSTPAGQPPQPQQQSRPPPSAPRQQQQAQTTGASASVPVPPEAGPSHFPGSMDDDLPGAMDVDFGVDDELRYPSPEQSDAGEDEMIAALVRDIDHLQGLAESLRDLALEYRGRLRELERHRADRKGKGKERARN